ncbi:deoxyribodipyrimidine photo-lyase [Thalassotalea sp. 1_MG-2023]|uniref:deoxyribodipyrimidine photo-lyase n=1 Tax=Thalassotalea sp. 1_MG-2023 TaxID=3062680 RepID=UPI0026E2E490|nr:deoxyribodipyrimidine photo-lyase [Thalassotalea sp. 1_MG-2023]MDO6427896.1 deoxyribodipyrimidine photo-lyase [Thalassotalea sp. 1_MG-2023]
MQLLWFRNDLRIHDNPALKHFLTHYKAGDRAVYILTPLQWQQHHWARIKIDLIKRHVHLLQTQLKALGVQLEIHQVDDFREQVEFLKGEISRQDSVNIIANEELEINERNRDKALADSGLSLTLFEADVIVSKGKVLNKAGDMFKVFTPFKRAWLSHVKTYGFEYLGKPSAQTLSVDMTDKSGYAADNDLLNSDNTSLHWPLVDDVEANIIPDFFANKHDQYHQFRDIPSIKGTSGLSPYLAIGALSPRYLLQLILNKHPDLLTAHDSSAFSWLNELIWRDFYRHLLHHFPKLCRHQMFNDKYANITWPYDKAKFNAWCLGQTGYPIVDAAMRQLNQTGWMHNRLRMVVASFLTKHLLIDWRLGEQYFMSTLIDGDLAANNGGWQWAASTGCDAQPYFRIFNPIRQGERFDPKGEFVRKYLPELDKVPDKHVHFPHGYMKSHRDIAYWPAIVDHKAAREQALAFYR